MQILSKNTLFYMLAVALIATTFLACTKPNALGADLIEDDNVYGELVVSDANTPANADFRMNTTTEQQDSVLVHDVPEKTHQSRFLLGVIDDPVFGKTTANIYLQPYTFGTKLDADMVVDSSVLFLQYDMPSGADTASTDVTNLSAYKTLNTVGDTLQPQTITIQTVTDNIDFNETYFSDKNFATSTDLVNLNHTFIPTPTTLQPAIYRNWRNTADSAVANRRLSPHIRIKMPSSFTQAIYKEEVLSSNDSLRSKLSALSIKASPTNTAILRFNLLANTAFIERKVSTLPSNTITSASKILFYGHRKTKPTERMVYRIAFAGFEQGVVFNNLKNERPAGSPIAKALQTKNIGDSVIYVQGMAGTNGRISFPNIGKLKGKVIINKAELVFKAISDNANIPKPDYLQLAKKLAKGKTFANVSLFQGVRDWYSNTLVGKLNGSTYTMNITYELEDLINGNGENVVDANSPYMRNLYVTMLSKAQRAQRVVLGGARNKTYAPVLKVYMTRI
jgi:Domain of unknown function (DUF4270)